MVKEIVKNNIKHRAVLKEFLESEFEDYSVFECYEIVYQEDYTDDEEISYFEVNYQTSQMEEKDWNTLNFRLSNDDTIEIEMGEDCWTETRNYDSSVKYFWIMVEWK